MSPDGSINLVAKGHLNGLSDTSALGCSACHGDATRKGNLPGTDENLISSPPVATPNARPYATGAHLGHLNPTVSSYLMAPIACAECHVVPLDSAHARTPPAHKVVFGPLSRAGGAIPTWTSTTTGCAATYCHGNFTFNGVSGSKATPLWTDTAPLTCTSCHGMPPTGHLAVSSATAASCAACHPDAVNADGTIALPPGVELAPGTTVRVEIPDKPACPSGARERVGSRLLRVSGRVKDAPVDWAANHDHYLHGGPARE